jgi:hypothetical protein
MEPQRVPPRKPDVVLDEDEQAFFVEWQQRLNPTKEHR